MLPLAFAGSVGGLLMLRPGVAMRRKRTVFVSSDPPLSTHTQTQASKHNCNFSIIILTSTGYLPVYGIPSGYVIGAICVVQ